MRKYAEVVNGRVVGVQFAESNPNKNKLIECGDDTLSGFSYENGKFTAKSDNTNGREIGADEFQDRFTFEEKVKIIENIADPRVRTFYDDIRYRKRAVNLDSPRFRLAMDLLLGLGIIAVGRDLELLSNENEINII